MRSVPGRIGPTPQRPPSNRPTEKIRPPVVQSNVCDPPADTIFTGQARRDEEEEEDEEDEVRQEDGEMEGEVDGDGASSGFTALGSVLDFSLPSPRRPYSPLPHVKRVPFSFTKQLCQPSAKRKYQHTYDDEKVQKGFYLRR